VFIVNEVQMDQLEPAGRSLTLPRQALVIGINHDAVNHPVILANRSDYPPFLLARESHAVEFRRRSIKFGGQETRASLQRLPLSWVTKIALPANRKPSSLLRK
jgi:hypothetical protein